MGTRESHAPGTFSWAELVTSDAGGAKAFYAGVLGWDYEDNPVGDGMVYSMATRDGRYVAALFGGDQPPHWNSYVTVGSADEAARRAGELGATVLAEPFDVLSSGRMAALQDPTGAVVMVWEPRDHIGAGLVNAPGALTWNDLMTGDVARAGEFYGALFGWDVSPVPGAPGGRLSIRNGGTPNGGIAALPPGTGGVPPHWLPYFAVEDAATATEQVGAGGGRVVAGPIEVPSGRFVVCLDPQGAGFGLIAGELDP